MGKDILFWNGGTNTNTKFAPTEDSVYRIGSVSKVFAWILALIAEAKGHVNLDEPVKKSVPELELIDLFFTGDARNSFTWNQLASHLAGLPRETPCLFLDCAVTTKEILQRLKSSHLKLPPNTTPYYSNLGFTLLGRLIADKVFATGESYEALVHRLILEPLGMKNTSFILPSKYVAPVPPQPLIDMKWNAPAGQMYSSARDLQRIATYLSESAQKFFSFGNPYNPFISFDPLTTSLDVSKSSEVANILGIRNDKIRLSMFPRFTNPDLTGFSTPWEMYQVAGYTVRAKGGNINFYSSAVALIPDLRLALTFLTNQNADENAIVSQILSVVAPNLTHALYSLQSFPTPPSNKLEYAGSYSSPNGGAAVIVPDLLGNLILSLQGIGNLVLVPTTFDAKNTKLLQIYIPESSNGLGCMNREMLSLSYEVVEFSLDSSGKFASFAIPGYLYGAVWTRTS